MTAYLVFMINENSTLIIFANFAMNSNFLIISENYGKTVSTHGNFPLSAGTSFEYTVKPPVIKQFLGYIDI